MKPHRTIAGPLLAVLLAAPSPAPVGCSALVGHDGVVDAAEVAATDAVPAYCRVTGVLRPVAGSRIGFEVWLPQDRAWSGRYQMLGNGGYSSILPFAQMRVAVAHGSAVVATDTGHDGDDPAFARGHPQAIVDWGWRAVHETARAGRRIVARRYGRPPHHAYFAGCSTGGHQAMMEAQRFPRDFDGILAGAPGADRVRLNAAFLWQFLSNHRPGDNTHPILDQRDLDLLQAHSLASCPAAEDGHWLANPLRCTPTPEALACPTRSVVGPGSCLSPEKLAAARRMYAGARDARTGTALTLAWLPGSESGWSGYWADPRSPSQPARLAFWRDWAFGATWDWWTFDAARDLPRAKSRLSSTIDADDADLSRFVARGGRLIQYHGLADPVVSPRATLAYRARMIKQTRGVLDSWYRLKLVAGMGHCSGGSDFDTQVAQTELERWVETGHGPT